MTLVGEIDRALRVCICHCAADKELVKRLDQVFSDEDRFDVTLERIPSRPKRTWKPDVAERMAAADAVMFILSPEAVATGHVGWLSDTADEFSKHVIAVLAKDLRSAELPAGLARLKLFQLADGQFVEQRAKLLVSALDENADWARTHTSLLQRAREWDQAGRPAELNLDATEVAAAKTWTFDRPEAATKPTDLHLEFIERSEMAATSSRTGTTRRDSTNAKGAPLHPGQPQRARRKPVAASTFDKVEDTSAPHRPHLAYEAEPQEPNSAGQPMISEELPEPDSLRLNAANARQTKISLQIVLGLALLGLTGAVAWQVLHRPVSQRLALVPAEAPVQHSRFVKDKLFSHQAAQIEHAMSKVDCLLSDSETQDCDSQASTKLARKQAVEPGDFDRNGEQ